MLLVVLAAALLHASWNLLVKRGGVSTRATTAVIYTAAGLLAALMLPWLAPLPRVAWPYLLSSTVVEVLYGVLLAAAYRVGDLSLAYPLMRGTAPLLVALGSGLLVGETLSAVIWGGIALVCGGILVMIADARPHGHARAAIRLALINAFVIAAYTIIDGRGVRASGAPLSYGAWIFVLTGIPWLLWLVLRGGAEVRSAPRLGGIGLVGGACSLVSYVAALWAMTRAPIAAVAAVRETSILFATALGALVLGERITRARALAAACIVAGVICIRSG
ncbi:MAG TPA: DMT family transporter [Steroidobacteraceae bacterium]|nr:DMT family transporter [Steroidobacteraceae bacterium]